MIYVPPFKQPEFGNSYVALKNFIHKWVDCYTKEEFTGKEMRELINLLDDTMHTILDPKFKMVVNNSESAATLRIKQEISNFVLDCSTLIILNKRKTRIEGMKMLDKINWLLLMLMKMDKRL